MMGIALSAFFLSAGLSSCFTGIENTGKINLSKKDLNVTAPTAEDKLMADISVQTLKEWQQGKAFIITDDKFLLLTEGMPPGLLSKGDTVYFIEACRELGAGGEEMTTIVFDAHGRKIKYPVQNEINAALSSLTVSDLAMLIDIDAVNSADRLLRGRTVWTRSASWYDRNLDYKKGKKFCKVTINSVSAGNTFFPLLVNFEDAGGNEGFFLMNTGISGNESRSFNKLFSLSDPKENYKNITSDMWKAIQSEQLKTGMTKEECRLSRGNPSDIDAGHSYSNTMEIWYYQDGTYLQFVDGLLVNFK